MAAADRRGCKTAAQLKHTKKKKKKAGKLTRLNFPAACSTSTVYSVFAELAQRHKGNRRPLFFFFFFFKAKNFIRLSAHHDLALPHHHTAKNTHTVHRYYKQHKNYYPGACGEPQLTGTIPS